MNARFAVKLLIVLSAVIITASCGSKDPRASILPIAQCSGGTGEIHPFILQNVGDGLFIGNDVLGDGLFIGKDVHAMPSYIVRRLPDEDIYGEMIPTIEVSSGDYVGERSMIAPGSVWDIQSEDGQVLGAVGWCGQSFFTFTEADFH